MYRVVSLVSAALYEVLLSYRGSRHACALVSIATLAVEGAVKTPHCILLAPVALMVAATGPEMTTTVAHSVVVVRCSTQHAILLDLSHCSEVVLECRIGRQFFLPDGLAVDMRA